MCVIMVSEDTRLTPEMVRAGFKANSHGAGFAWREPVMEGVGKKAKAVLRDDNTPKMKVRWKKAITDVDEVVELSQKLPLPYILHCRIPSIGGPNIDLTHPFPICKDVRLDHEGEIDGDVLFHNGTWSRWDAEMFKAALLRGVKLPRAPFSDSRMMAWITYLLGFGFLDAIDEKVIVFGPYDIDIWGKERGWECVNNVWCSNGGFRRLMDQPKREPDRSHILGPRPLREINETRSSTSDDLNGGGRQVTGFRGGAPSVDDAGSEETGENLQGNVQGRTRTIRQTVGEIISAAVENVGQKARHPLTENEKFVAEYRRLHGKPPPYRQPDWPPTNPKKFKSSCKVGDIEPGDIANLAKRRDDASKGISHVL